MKSRAEILEKKYKKVLNEIIKEFLLKQELDYQDLDYYDFAGFKIGDMKFTYDLALKDLVNNAPKGLIFDYFDNCIIPKKNTAYLDYIKGKT
jgi:hypothetical protein